MPGNLHERSGGADERSQVQDLASGGCGRRCLLIAGATDCTGFCPRCSWKKCTSWASQRSGSRNPGSNREDNCSIQGHRYWQGSAWLFKPAGT